MNRSAILETLRAYLAELLEVSPGTITEKQRLREDLDLDSIDAIDLIVRIQEVTGVRMNPEQFRSVTTVGDVVDRVDELLNAKA